MTPIYKKGWKEGLGNYRPVNLTSVPGKVMEQFTLPSQSTCSTARPSQHGFGKGKSCLNNPISFSDKVTCLVGEGKAVDDVYLHFLKLLTLSPQSI